MERLHFEWIFLGRQKMIVFKNERPSLLVLGIRGLCDVIVVDPVVVNGCEMTALRRGVKSNGARSLLVQLLRLDFIRFA